MKVKPQAAIAVTLIVFVFGILITSAAGIWTTKMAKTPAKLRDAQFSGAYDPSDIRGSHTFSDISALYGIPLEDLAAAFGIDESAANTFKCKDLESIYGGSPNEIGTASVKMFAACYLGLPYDPTEETYLPQSAAQILTEKGAMSQAQRDYLQSHTVLTD